MLIIYYLYVRYIQYLGSIPGVTDWQSPDSRSDFLEMIDEGQVRMHFRAESRKCMLVHNICSLNSVRYCTAYVFIPTPKIQDLYSCT